MFHPRTLSLITTHRCTAACSNCCFSCSPQHEGPTVPSENLKQYITEAAAFGSFEVVVFTGGECFLYGKSLDDMISHATSHHLKTRFVSNGYWATSMRVARERVKTLVESGLTEANFSTGDNHQKFVKLDYVMNGAVACAESGLNTVVMVEIFSEMKFEINTFFANERFLELCNEGKIKILASPWMPFEDKAIGPEYSEEYLNTANKKSRSCTSIYDVVAVNPAEYLIACCGLTLEEIPELRLGKLGEGKSLGDILREATKQCNMELAALSAIGPHEMVETVGSGHLVRGCAHICDACRVYHRQGNIREQFLQALDTDNKLSKRIGDGLITNSIRRTGILDSQIAFEDLGHELKHKNMIKRHSLEAARSQVDLVKGGSKSC